MSRFTLFAIALAVVAIAGSAHAQAKTRVWVYGDGNSTRMFSELEHLSGFSDGLDIKNHAVETSGPDTLEWQVAVELWYTPQASWPKVVLIGYSASRFSLTACARGEFVGDAAAAEAGAILRAALWLRSVGVKVLLSRGPGAPATREPGQQCMEQAFSIVNAIVSQAGFPTVNWSLTRTVRGNWAYDGIHVSCDGDYFKSTWQGNFCAIVGPNGEEITNPPRAGRPIGALTVAQRVLAALQSFR